MSLENLEPKLLWRCFDAIRRVPRPSKHEEKIRTHIVNWAKEHKLEPRVDDAGNVVVPVPATPGCENAPGVVLQTHMDMVCEKNKDVEFDFMADPIEVKVDGDWLTAKGTTLGADNGVGLAASLAIAEDPDAVHGPLEILVTVDEETGLTGAGALSPDLLEGRRLLNLDTEELNALYIGCAGGGDSNLQLPLVGQTTPADAAALELKIKGLRGGHSGMDIVEQRGNAVKALVRVLRCIDQQYPLHLFRFEGGGVHNAIPREAFADITVPAAALDAVTALARAQTDAVRAELGATDPGLELEIIPSDSAPDRVWSPETTKRLIGLLSVLPHGVDSMSRDVPGLVETSNNLASVWTRDESVVVGTSSRSSVGSALDDMRARIRAAGRLAGATVEEDEAYPGWKPDLDSKVLAVAKKVHEETLGIVPEVKAVHAGLECGIIGEKCPGMDMVSFGPTIEAPHSPDERVNIVSVGTFWKYLKAVLAELSAV